MQVIGRHGRWLKKMRSTLEGRSKSSPIAEWTLLHARWALARWRSRRSDLEHATQAFAQRGERWNPEDPKTFNEKLWFLKLSNRDPLLTECSDKHRARDYVRRCGYGHTLKKEYGAYHSAHEIDFETLASPAYIKCNHGSGLNWVYRSGAKNRTIRQRQRAFDFTLKQNPYLLSREWNYKHIDPMVICEEFLASPDGSDIPELQFFCFHGEVKFIMYNLGLADADGRHATALRWVFDTNFELIDMKTSMASGSEVPPKPANFDSMLEQARVLSKPFPHVRVDLFDIAGDVYFNEMTFYSGGGFVKLEPESWQETVGSWIDLGEYSIAKDAREGGWRRVFT